jgi:hypothetical protein
MRKSIMGGLSKLNNWVLAHRNSFSSWSSLITLISFPLIVVGLFVGIHQVRDILTLPDPELEFVHPASVSYKVINRSGKTAEDILVSFGIFDLDSSIHGPVPIPSVSYDWVNKHSEKGPFAWFTNFAIRGHRYFGIVYVGCKGGERVKTYWIYVKHGSVSDCFYAERNKSDTYQINVGQLAVDKNYLETLVPVSRRKAIK